MAELVRPRCIASLCSADRPHFSTMSSAAHGKSWYGLQKDAEELTTKTHLLSSSSPLRRRTEPLRISARRTRKGRLGQTSGALVKSQPVPTGTMTPLVVLAPVLTTRTKRGAQRGPPIPQLESCRIASRDQSWIPPFCCWRWRRDQRFPWSGSRKCSVVPRI